MKRTANKIAISGLIRLFAALMLALLAIVGEAAFSANQRVWAGERYMSLLIVCRGGPCAVSLDGESIDEPSQAGGAREPVYVTHVPVDGRPLDLSIDDRCWRMSPQEGVHHLSMTRDGEKLRLESDLVITPVEPRPVIAVRPQRKTEEQHHIRITKEEPAKNSATDITVEIEAKTPSVRIPASPPVKLAGPVPPVSEAPRSQPPKRGFIIGTAAPDFDPQWIGHPGSVPPLGKFQCPEGTIPGVLGTADRIRRGRLAQDSLDAWRAYMSAPPNWNGGFAIVSRTVIKGRYAAAVWCIDPASVFATLGQLEQAISEIPKPERGPRGPRGPQGPKGPVQKNRLASFHPWFEAAAVLGAIDGPWFGSAALFSGGGATRFYAHDQGAFNGVFARVGGSIGFGGSASYDGYYDGYNRKAQMIVGFTLGAHVLFAQRWSLGVDFVMQKYRPHATEVYGEELSYPIAGDAVLRWAVAPTASFLLNNQAAAPIRVYAGIVLGRADTGLTGYLERYFAVQGHFGVSVWWGSSNSEDTDGRKRTADERLQRRREEELKERFEERLEEEEAEELEDAEEFTPEDPEDPRDREEAEE